VTDELVLTVIGADKPGLVEALSTAVADGGGNWEASRMAHMAGRFAGILRVTVPADKADALVASVRGVPGLNVDVERGSPTGAVAGNRLQLEMVGHDRLGLVRDISHALAERGINIVELSTECDSAPMAGHNLLKVRAELACPDDVSSDDLRGALESVAGDYMVDLHALGSES
jgi:glycine cleavage system regulatory protein